MLFVSDVPPPVLGQRLREVVGREAEELLMSTAERLIQEGLAKGLAQGRVEGHVEGLVEGQRAVLLRLPSLASGPLPLRVKARVARATAAELGVWAERVLSASDLDHVLA